MSWPERRAARAQRIKACAPGLWNDLKAAIAADLTEYRTYFQNTGATVEVKEPDRDRFWLVISVGRDPLTVKKRNVHIIFDADNNTVAIEIDNPGRRLVYGINVAESADSCVFVAKVHETVRMLSAQELSEEILSPLLP